MPIDFSLLNKSNDQVSTTIKSLFDSIDSQRQAVQKARQLKAAEERNALEARGQDMQYSSQMQRLALEREQLGQQGALTSRGQDMQMARDMESGRSNMATEDWRNKSLEAAKTEADRSFALDQTKADLAQQNSDRSFALDSMKDAREQRAFDLSLEDRLSIRQAGEQGLDALKEQYLKMGDTEKAFGIDEARQRITSTGINDLYKVAMIDQMQAGQGLTEQEIKAKEYENLITEDGLVAMRKGAFINQALSRVMAVKDPTKRPDAIKAAVDEAYKNGAGDFRDLDPNTALASMAYLGNMSNAMASTALGSSAKRRKDQQPDPNLMATLVGEDSPQWRASMAASMFPNDKKAQTEQIKKMEAGNLGYYPGLKHTSDKAYDKVHERALEARDKAVRFGQAAEQFQNYIDENPGIIGKENIWKEKVAALAEASNLKESNFDWLKDRVKFDTAAVANATDFLTSLQLQMANEMPRGPGSQSDKEFQSAKDQVAGMTTTDDAARLMLGFAFSRRNEAKFYANTLGIMRDKGMSGPEIDRKVEEYRKQYPMLVDGKWTNQNAYTDPKIWDDFLQGKIHKNVGGTVAEKVDRRKFGKGFGENSVEDIPEEEFNSPSNSENRGAFRRNPVSNTASNFKKRLFGDYE